MKILIVDDDNDNRMILKAVLEEAGYQTQEAVNGEQCLDMTQKGRFDLIVLDIMMPKLDGWNTCKSLKSNSQTNPIPVVVLTARNQPIDELHGMECGADAYLTKPTDPPSLLKTIQTFLHAKTPAEQKEETPTNQKPTALIDNAKILVMDDDPDTCTILKKVFEDEGFQVHLAANGEIGLDLAKDGNFHLIILDIMMPKIDGWNT
ncbi:MAG: response regulator, partial [Elusimicrobia bacterium]|nr:response regulator [Elusimicrobiota bacterium]